MIPTNPSPVARPAARAQSDTSSGGTSQNATVSRIWGGRSSFSYPMLSREWNRTFLNIGMVVVTDTSPNARRHPRQSVSRTGSSILIWELVIDWV